MPKVRAVLKSLPQRFSGMSFLQAARVCLYLFCIFVPFQARLFFQGADLYQSGQLSLYTNFFLYLSDIFLVLSLLFLGFSFLTVKTDRPNLKFGDRNLFAVLLVFIFLIEISAFWAGDSFQAFMTMIRFVEFLIFYLLVLNTGVSMRLLIKIFIFAAAAQAIFGILQYVFQSSIGLSILGEPLLSRDLPGAAKVDLGLVEFLRSYGTFAHPNVFGGFLVFGILLAFSRLSEDKFLYMILLFVMLIALVLTFSRSAWLALLFAGFFYVFVTRPRLRLKYVLLGFLVFLVFLAVFDLDKLFLNRIVASGDPALSARAEYMEISKDMFLDRPFGVGIGNFTLEMQKFADQKLMPWDLQPVHNVFLLAVNEAGVFVFPVLVGLFVYIFSVVFRKRREFVSGGDRKYGVLILGMLFAFLIISNLDHYPFSLYQGQFLFFLYLLIVNDFILRRVSV